MNNLTKHLIFIFFLIWFYGKIYSGWSDQTLTYNNILQSVSTVDENCCWICALYNPLVLRTTDGGLTWETFENFNIDSLHAKSIVALSQNIAFVLTGYSDSLNVDHEYLFKTSNGGFSWSIVLTQENGYFDNLGFKDFSNGFLIGDPVGGRWSFWRTTNQGLTWDSTGLYLPTTDLGSYTKDIKIIGDSIWFGTADYKIYYSYDFGTNWNTSLVNSQIILTLTMNGNVGFAAESNTYKTTNGGINWFPVSLYHSWPIYSFNSVNNQFWYSFDDSIYYSSDGGNNFIFQHSLSNYDFIWQIDLKKINNVIIGWAVGQWGNIAKYNEPIGIKPISSEIPNKFELSHNYPNPFNPNTSINYRIQKAGNVKLVIYDILGRKIATLVNEYQQPGKYQVNWDASTFASGVYFYKVILFDPAGNDFVAVKKMVYIK